VKVAAIDLGSNSIHMVIAEMTARGGFQVIDREAEMVRLGSGSLSTGLLTKDGMSRTVSILRAYRRLAQIHKVEETVAFATSAIREARNGEDFLERLGRETGIWARAIPGEEEARLIHIAALHSIHTQGRRTLVVDVGGGSVEIVLGRRTGIDLAVSLKLGALRMTEQILGRDAMDERKLASAVRRALKPHAARIVRLGFDRAVGTSGTTLALGRLVLAARGGARPESTHHVVVSAKELRAVRERLTSLDLRRRLKMPGIDRRRADVLPAGAIVLDTILSRLGVEELTLCEWALREGILLDFASRRRSVLARADANPDVRRRSVFDLLERLACDGPHARHVARLALDLFNATRSVHRLSDSDRALLEYASLLHDVGQHISRNQHHKHSYYLIQHADLHGFDPREIEIMANVARYHRGGTPSKRHAGFAALGRDDRGRVVILSGLLRLAEALDRTHRQRVRSVSRSRAPRALKLVCRTSGDVELEKWGAPRHLEFLQDALGARLTLSFSASEGRVPSARKIASSA
jgi:exopolyphosphatase/guanosine-5'-triphosphate,3'-diphosphate pyrophosphatase